MGFKHLQFGAEDYLVIGQQNRKVVLCRIGPGQEEALGPAVIQANANIPEMLTQRSPQFSHAYRITSVSQWVRNTYPRAPSSRDNS